MQKRTKVGIVHCGQNLGKPGEYSREQLDSVKCMIQEIADHTMGGMKNIVSRGDKVLIKINTVIPIDPNAGFTTDPRMLEALIELVQEQNPARIQIGERCAMGADTRHAMDVCGVTEVAKRTGVELCPFEHAQFDMYKIDRPISFEAMADDIAALITYLGLEKADVMGYSLGGGVALRVAIQHPDVVRKLVLVSTVFKRDGWYPEILAGMSQMGPGAVEPMKQTPMYQLYARVAPRLADWPVLLTKLGNLLRKDYDWSKEVAALRTPTLLVVGDADAVRTSHAVEFFELLGGGKRDGGWDGSGMSNARLAILPGQTHYTIFASQALVSTVTPFLDAAVPAAR